MFDKKDTERGHNDSEISEATVIDKNKIDKETAEAEFVAYCDANDIDCDINTMTDEEKDDFKPIKDRFIKACMRGRIEADGVNLKYTISDFSIKEFRGRVISIKRPDGHAFIGMDGYKDTQSVHRMNGFLSAMTGQEVVFFTKIDRADWLLFRDIATLFLVG
jgi:hypothetical protein